MPLMAPENWSDQTPKPLLLIAAQSGRFLAQIAHRAGYPVRVADQFADTDTLAVAEQHLLLADFEALSERTFLDAVISLAAGQSAVLIIGTGLERFFNCLEQLPANIQSANNPCQSLRRCLTPRDWFTLLSELAIAYPQSQFSRPATPDHYLLKSSRHWGGGHIQNAGQATTDGDYYQQHIQGRSGSVLFIADGEKARPISLNQQFCRAPLQQDFRLQAITNRLTTDENSKARLANICQKLTMTLTLRGFQSLDFIIGAGGEIRILELNPRPGASLQCLPTDWPLINWHLDACQGRLPPIEDWPAAASRLWYGAYADTGLTIPASFNWPVYACDLPAAGMHIARNQIICSLLLDCPADNILPFGQNLATQLQLQLKSTLETCPNSAI